jgi:predicted nucleic acid-binding protein
MVDASPLISLDQIGSVHLLARLSGEVLVPPAVMAEVSAGTVALAVENLGPHRIVQVDRLDPGVAAWDLGAGETEVLSWIIANSGAIAILDDRCPPVRIYIRDSRPRNDWRAS